MERKFYNDNLEQLLKEKSDEFRMYPSRRVWHSIYNNLHPARKWPSIAMSMLLIIALLFIGYLNTNNTANTKANTGAKHPAGEWVVAQSGQSSTGLLSFPDANMQQPGNTTTTTTAAVAPASSNSGINNKALYQPGNSANIPTASTSISTPVETVSNSTINSALKPANRSRWNNNLSENSRGSIKTNITNAALNEYNNDKNQLYTDVSRPEKNKQSTATAKEDAVGTDDGLTNDKPSSFSNPANNKLQNPENRIPSDKAGLLTENKVSSVTEKQDAKNNTASNKRSISLEDKAWMENDIFHNKAGRQKWKDRLSVEFYATPSIGYRNLVSNVQNDILANSLAASANAGAPVNKTINQQPGLGLEAGAGFSYSLSKSFLLKGAVQVNYTNYGISADETNHPVLTTLLMNDPLSGIPFLSSRSSTLSNSSGLQPVTLHNNTYQLSIPVGVAFKLAGTRNLGWFVGATLQPTMVIAGTANLISSDYNNYISDPSLLRRWNMNTGFETYIHYKLKGYTLQVGPQFRYQLFSTYSNKYTFNENLYNMGLKVGFVKSF